MNRLLSKRDNFKKRVRRVRHRTTPKGDRYRMVFNRSNRYLSVQIIDDVKGHTLCSASTREKSFEGNARNLEAAKKLGGIIAARAKEKGIATVYLDRRGSLYHGRIAEFAGTARSEGLEF